MMIPKTGEEIFYNLIFIGALVVLTVLLVRACRGPESLLSDLVQKIKLEPTTLVGRFNMGLVVVFLLVSGIFGATGPLSILSGQAGLIGMVLCIVAAVAFGFISMCSVDQHEKRIARRKKRRTSRS